MVGLLSFFLRRPSRRELILPKREWFLALDRIIIAENATRTWGGWRGEGVCVCVCVCVCECDGEVEAENATWT